MGRRKISIAPIQDDRNRSVTFLKRKNGLFKKAFELGVLCKADVAVIVFNSSNKLYEFHSGDMDQILLRYSHYAGPAHEKRGPDYYASSDSADLAKLGLGGKMTSLEDEEEGANEEDEVDDEEEDALDDGDDSQDSDARKGKGKKSRGSGRASSSGRKKGKSGGAQTHDGRSESPDAHHNFYPDGSPPDPRLQSHQHHQQQQQAAAAAAAAAASNYLSFPQAPTGGFNPYSPFSGIGPFGGQGFPGAPPNGWNPNATGPANRGTPPTSAANGNTASPWGAFGPNGLWAMQNLAQTYGASLGQSSSNPMVPPGFPGDFSQFQAAYAAQSLPPFFGGPGAPGSNPNGYGGSAAPLSQHASASHPPQPPTSQAMGHFLPGINAPHSHSGGPTGIHHDSPSSHDSRRNSIGNGRSSTPANAGSSTNGDRNGRPLPKPRLSLNIPSENGTPASSTPGSILNRSDEITAEPESIDDHSHSHLARRNSLGGQLSAQRYGADLLPSPSTFLNEIAYSGNYPLSALGNGPSGSNAANGNGSEEGQSVFNWPGSKLSNDRTTSDSRSDAEDAARRFRPAPMLSHEEGGDLFGDKRSHDNSDDEAEDDSRRGEESSSSQKERDNKRPKVE